MDPFRSRDRIPRTPPSGLNSFTSFDDELDRSVDHNENNELDVSIIKSDRNSALYFVMMNKEAGLRERKNSQVCSTSEANTTVIKYPNFLTPKRTSSSFKKLHILSPIDNINPLSFASTPKADLMAPFLDVTPETIRPQMPRNVDYPAVGCISPCISEITTGSETAIKRRGRIVKIRKSPEVTDIIHDADLSEQPSCRYNLRRRGDRNISSLSEFSTQQVPQTGKRARNVNEAQSRKKPLTISMKKSNEPLSLASTPNGDQMAPFHDLTPKTIRSQIPKNVEYPAFGYISPCISKMITESQTAIKRRGRTVKIRKSPEVTDIIHDADLSEQPSYRHNLRRKGTRKTSPHSDVYTPQVPQAGKRSRNVNGAQSRNKRVKSSMKESNESSFTTDASCTTVSIVSHSSGSANESSSFCRRSQRNISHVDYTDL